MIKETLKNGFEVEIPDENLDDYELLEDLAALDEGEENTGKIVSGAYKRLLGGEQYKALKEHIRSEAGRVSATAMLETLQEIFELQDGELKN